MAHPGHFYGDLLVNRNGHSFKARNTALAVTAGLPVTGKSSLSLTLLIVLIITVLSGAGSPA